MSPRHCKRRLACRTAHGFTLIEILTVVAIVCLLVAISLPSLQAARTRSHRLACASNLRQIHAGWTLYWNDHNGRFYRAKENADMLYGGWKGVYYCTVPRPLNKYLGLPPLPESESRCRVFRCPGEGPAESSYHHLIGTSYRMNIVLTGQDALGGSLAPLNARLPNLTVDRADNHAQLLLMGDFNWWKRLEIGLQDEVMWHRKKQHYNMVFLDGHVEFVLIQTDAYRTPTYTAIPFRDSY